MIVLLFFLQACLAIQPILMKDMEVLSFYNDGITGTIRGQPIPQMVLLTPGVPEHAVPKEIVCKNIGWDGLNVHWDCSSEMKSEWNIENPIISCEGWSGPGDEYVVPGSCSISYELKYTPKPVTESEKKKNYEDQYSNTYGRGERFFHDPYRENPRNYRESNYRNMKNERYYDKYKEDSIDDNSDIMGFLFFIACVLIIVSGFGIVKFFKFVTGNNSGKKTKDSNKKEKEKEKKDTQENIDTSDVVEKHKHVLSYSR